MCGCLYLSSLCLKVLKTPLLVQRTLSYVVILDSIDNLVPYESVLDSAEPITLELAVVGFVFYSIYERIVRFERFWVNLRNS